MDLKYKTALIRNKNIKVEEKHPQTSCRGTRKRERNFKYQIHNQIEKKKNKEHTPKKK